MRSIVIRAALLAVAFVAPASARVLAQGVVASEIDGSSADSALVQTGKKSPLHAWASSVLFPGGGQWYNGERRKAAAFISTGTVGAMVLFAGAFSCSGDSCPAAVAGLAIFLGSSIWSQIDAFTTARAINRKLQTAGIDFRPRLDVVTEQRAGVFANSQVPPARLWRVSVATVTF